MLEGQRDTPRTARIELCRPAILLFLLPCGCGHLDGDGYSDDYDDAGINNLDDNHGRRFCHEHVY